MDFTSSLLLVEDKSPDLFAFSGAGGSIKENPAVGVENPDAILHPRGYTWSDQTVIAD